MQTGLYYSGIECTSATEEILASGINIGVSQDKINIDGTKSGIIDRLFIYDIQGRQILVARPMAQEFSVPIDQFIAGVYVIRIQLGSVFVNKKILIP
ncbi:MAG: T9SS type A sorting domain-containing protein [Saprospiraceae bacterium]|nr:T9SS type A sorting domain-containing protein [Saprospiraceae bacterium]